MSASVLLLCSALCTVAGGALGAAWRRAETRLARRDEAWWTWKARNWESLYLDLKDARYYGLPEHDLPMSCQVGERAAISEQLEGPTRASSVDDLMRGEP